MKQALRTVLIFVLGGWACSGLAADAPVATPGTDSTPVLAPAPGDAILPGFRSGSYGVALAYNPFEPIREIKTDVNSDIAKGIIKRLKGFVVQKVGAPLLVIDDKSYKVGDKVELDVPGTVGDVPADQQRPVAEGANQAEATPAARTATIVSASQTEAVFRINDETGFGNEEFKIYYNFNNILDEKGDPAYALWTPVASGFFVTDDGILVAPLDAIRGSSEVSVLTATGPSRATLFESDENKGIALLKVYTNSVPLPLASGAPEIADPVFAAAFWPEKSPKFCLKEGFVMGENDALSMSPAVPGELDGAAVLNRQGGVIGMLVGQTDSINTIAHLNITDTIFRKVFRKNLKTGLPEQGTKEGTVSRSDLERAVVPILRKCDNS